MDKHLNDSVTLTIAELKNIYLEGKQRSVEELEVETNEREEDKYDALDFGDFLKAVHNINLI